MTAAPVPPAPATPPAPASPSSGALPATSPYNWIYKELVNDPDDAVGAIAYVLYKRDKIAFIEATQSAHGRVPTPDELKVFHTQTCEPAKIRAYRAHAQQLANAFLHSGLAQRMREFEDEIRESVLNQNVSAVLLELKSKKSLGAWFGDIVGNLGVNMLTIIVIGALLGGYQALAKFNANVQKIANIPVTTETPAPKVTQPPRPDIIEPEPAK
ncbi:hypothetical protein RBA41_22690 [Massilia sp. CCM 9210]|uniref:hypothetical protein n=1 Tax=Massilia scottii TaxID=3057166 RepID=UPI002796554C|nr:hypothetical protein [Massilia sp. CCM 9210]MDQ1816109.1 hypothetical protein [Massilia sp. CCM 9210]